jgi:hypothetical protein
MKGGPQKDMWFLLQKLRKNQNFKNFFINVTPRGGRYDKYMY